MIIGAHAIIFSQNPDVDRAFLKDVLAFSHVDVGGGWLIFGLPPAEVAVHPSEKNDVHELYLMCDDVNAFVDQMSQLGIACGPIQDPGWGLLTELALPGGGKLGVYEPRHARPETEKAPEAKAASKPARKKPATKSAKKAAKKSAKKAAKKNTKKPAKAPAKKAAKKRTAKKKTRPKKSRR